MRKNLVLIIFLLTFSSPAVNAADYDPLNTVCALNLAIVSVNRILAAHDRITLEHEYNRIINRLAIGNIEGDPEMTALYSDLMNFITGKTISAQEKKRLSEISRLQEQEAYYRAMSKGFANVRAPEDSPENKNFLGWLAGLAVSSATSTAAGYYDYQAAKEQLKREFNTESWELTKQEIQECNKLQVRLLNSSWRLMSQYKIPNEYRLTQENVREFLNIMDEKDSLKRLGRLKFIERKFKVYPPYWYFRAISALESGNESECSESYKKFNEVWRSVLNYDPYKLEAVKYEICQFAKYESLSSENISKIKSLIEIVRDYTLPDDWESNIFTGTVYYALGDKDEAINCIEYGNIASGLEKDISGVMLAQMKSGQFSADSVASALKILFDEREKREYEALKTTEEIKAAAERGNIYAQSRLGFMYRYGDGGLLEDETQAVYWWRKAAEGGDPIAQFYLGNMYENGEGVHKDLNEARKWYELAAKGYRKAAKGWDPIAQYYLDFMYKHRLKYLNKARCKWYELAVKQGHPLAKMCLERLNNK